MPAEWEPHEATWIGWPHNKGHWPGKYDFIPATFAAIIAALAMSEKVYLTVNDQQMEEEARLMLSMLPVQVLNQLTFFHIPTDASWSRDHGPIFVYDEKQKLTLLNFTFNAWGEKYHPFDRDNAVPEQIAKKLRLPLVTPHMVLEGGSIDVNGAGSLLTTEQCLLNPNRNPSMSKEQIEEHLKNYLGISQVLWLNEGIVGDDTDGHVDDLARFVSTNTIVTVLESNPNDENYAILQENYARLKQMKNLNGEPFELITLPMPEPVYFNNQRLPASYANFYIANSVVLVPIFNCSQDAEALRTLRTLFPQHRVVSIDCVDLVWGLGTIHCSTQQQPIQR